MAIIMLFATREMFRPSPAIATGYLSHVRDVAATIPPVIGAWRGNDQPVPEAATALLHPNVIVSRGFQNNETKQSIGFLLVQCSDARDLDGHYPPNCYPGAGWELISSKPRTWQIKSWCIEGTEYSFSRRSSEGDELCTVDDFFIMPDGRFFSTMSTFRRAAHDFKKRFFGGAQMQIVFSGETIEEARQAVFAEMVGGYAPLIEAIRSGCNP